ncbi:MAG: S-adenosyl-l-methionine hydroxide adenosyltransferase family protein [Firmicutes bacterium]|nr:S-adenosyl-l-methionine hydroxide adenosyltransferase family protein [Bacillota bacterium]
MEKSFMNPLVFQSDFGLEDGAVSAMYGVAYSVDPTIRMFDLTHEIEPYNIWDASYRLIQAVTYWPAGTVFVSVVDPGVGSGRRSIAVLTSQGQIIVTPDNGTLTHIKRMLGIREARSIDESRNRLKGSEESYTFHGRDVYAYTGARLAAGVITFEEVGPLIDPSTVVELATVAPTAQDDFVSGTVDVLDIRFGSLWTNISKALFDRLGIQVGETVEIMIENDTRILYHNLMKFTHSFAEVRVGEPLLYVNSLGCMAVAINQGSFARAYNIGTGNSWRITIRPSRFQL